VELLIDVTGYSSEGQPTETQKIAVAWERPDLERLLREGSGDRIELTFDRAAIEAAMSDVEAHGMREKALIVAVAATAALGGAATANAANMIDTGGTASGSSYVVASDTSSDLASPGVAGEAAKTTTAASPTLSPDDRAVDFSTSAVAAADTSASFSSPGVAGEAAKAPAAAPAQTLSPDDRAVDFSTPTPAPSLSPDDRPVSFASPDTPATSLSPDDRAVSRSWPEPAPVVAVSDDGGISLEAPSPEAVALGGAIALAITAAAFAAASRRRVTPAS
jgi:hypothetical protein